MKNSGWSGSVSTWLMLATATVAVTGLAGCNDPTEPSVVDSTAMAAAPETSSAAAEQPSMAAPIETITAEEIQLRREAWVKKR